MASHLKHLHHETYQEHIVEKAKDCPEIIRLRLLQNVVETVSVNGRPFFWILDSGYHSNIRSKLQKLSAAGHPLNLTDSNLPEVKKHLHKMALAVIAEIGEEVKDRCLSLMVDIATRNNRSIFGASIQFIKDGELKIRSIGMIELNKSHTAIYLADVVSERLEVFGINLKQIITITTDNGSNVKKMVEDIEAALLKGIQTEASQLHARNSSSVLENTTADNVDAEIKQLLQELDDITDDQAMDQILKH